MRDGGHMRPHEVGLGGMGGQGDKGMGGQGGLVLLNYLDALPTRHYVC
ncbi:MAG: hypothetical protein KME31_27515 [Tolypothrix carrinoi HA7290-LM1]|jgi:hypothetical protein|nr:hypothetical protein [Tolypothrix carrinoi HA7290-LM1]